MDNPPTVTIIIPAYNAADTIGQCLRSIDRLDYPQDRLDVIVVDNGSTDDTVQLVRNSGHRVEILPEGNVGAVRNHGAGKASGEILAHTDSDCILPRTWLSDAVRLLSDDAGAGAVGGGCTVPDDATVLERSWVSVQAEEVKQTAFLPGCNIVMRRKLFDAIGGFNEAISAGEDDELSVDIRRQGFHLLSARACYVCHLGYPKSLFTVLKRQIWHGRNALAIYRKSWKMLAITILFLVSLLSIPALLFMDRNSDIALVAATGMLIGMPLLLTVRKARSNHRFDPVGSVVLFGIFFCFLLGRSAGLLWSLVSPPARQGRPQTG